MTGTLTFVLGLAGSGKSYFIDHHLSGYDHRLDEGFAHEPDFERNYAELVTLLRQGKRYILSELKYLDPANRDPFVQDVRRDVPGVKIEYYCFRNDLEIANRNCRVRPNQKVDRGGAEHI